MRLGLLRATSLLTTTAVLTPNTLLAVSGIKLTLTQSCADDSCCSGDGQVHQGPPPAVPNTPASLQRDATIWTASIDQLQQRFATWWDNYGFAHYPGTRVALDKKPDDAKKEIRIRVLLESYERVVQPHPEHAGLTYLQFYHKQAQANLVRWAANFEAKYPAASAQREAMLPSAKTTILLIEGDWGLGTSALTKTFGKAFTVLNMANARVFGGGFKEGPAAQEENLFRRTDVGFTGKEVAFKQPDAGGKVEYTQEWNRAINGMPGSDYYLPNTMRVCFRGPEQTTGSEFSTRTPGYDFLPPQEVFPLYELRAAAENLKEHKIFNLKDAFQAYTTNAHNVKTSMFHRIRKQFAKATKSKKKYLVLSAFGAGAFNHPADEVADLYFKQLMHDAAKFKGGVIAFVILGSAGYGYDNYSVFKSRFLAWAKRTEHKEMGASQWTFKVHDSVSDFQHGKPSTKLTQQQEANINKFEQAKMR
ncbi:unnamed protein product [Amoebophrya sp. A25]|nr:unnamed protein product [Amoebophrya sp. A25]|eukprot:GSA25T00010057001.1